MSTDIRNELEATVVRPIFDSTGVNGKQDHSLPKVVLTNRRSRALTRVVDALTSRGASTIPSEVRTRLESMIEAWSNQSFDDAFQPIQEFEIQCARERDLVLAQESGDSRRVLEVLESRYRRDLAERFGSIELRGIQLSHKVVLDLKRVYVPLHFEPLNVKGVGEKGDVIVSESARRLPITEIVKRSTRIFLIGAPGSGKSTLISFLASRSAVGNHGLEWPDRALPFVIVVRELKDFELSPTWLAKQLAVAPEVISVALSQERAVLLVDGLDEAPEELRRQLVGSLATFTAEHQNTPVIVTSRPAGAPGEMESCLPGFDGFRLADLTDEEVDEFIDKWCLAAERSARSDFSEAEKQANAAASDLKSRIMRSRPVQRIAVNPLLTTILCVVHRFLGRTIPEHRVTLYEKCTDALLYEWDRAKFPKGAAVGTLDANQKRALLRGVASALHERHEAEIAEQDVVRHFAAMLPQMGRPQEDALRMVREIRDRSGILVERRPGAFAFSHLTFQEYLTALDYASRSAQLIERLGDPWWQEVIALTVGVPGCDPSEIIQALLNKTESRGAVVLAAKCVETAVNVPLDLRKKVEDAIEGILPPRDLNDALRLREIGLTVAPILTGRLRGYDDEGKINALFFFHAFEYEPVIPVLSELSTDKSRAVEIVVGVGGDSYPMTIGELAILVLNAMAKTSESARRALVSALSRPISQRFLAILKPWDVLGPGFRASHVGRRSSKRARNTA